MDWAHVFLLATNVVFVSFGIVSVKRNMEMMEKLDDVSDAIDVCIEELSLRQESISAKLKMDVFSDEPVVKDLVLDMKEAKALLSRVKRVLDDSLEETEGDE